MARKMRKKTRNIVSGILVCVAAIFAVINFAGIPAAEVGRFVLSTLILLVAIILLALLAVSVFKLLGWLKNKVAGNDDDARRSPHSPDANDRE